MINLPSMRMTLGDRGLRAAMGGIVIGVISIGWASSLRADNTRLVLLEPADQYREVLDINQLGDQLLHREDALGPGRFSLSPIIRPAGGNDELQVPVPDTFTNVEMFRLSEQHQAVGFATRPFGHPEGNQRAMIWNWKQKTIKLLEPPQGLRGSCAFDISSDGTTVSGFVLGRDPPRMMPCIWQATNGQWECCVLPTPSQYNPFLTSGHVVISDDGRRVAASVATLRATGLSGPNQLHQWQRTDEGKWSGQAIDEHAVHVAQINNRGVVVGRVTEKGKRKAFVYDPDRGSTILNPLPGDDNCEATDVNNVSDIVGISDDPPGPEGGSVAVKWQQARLEALAFPVNSVFSTARTITDDGRIGGWIALQPDHGPERAATAAFILHSRPRPNEGD